MTNQLKTKKDGLIKRFIPYYKPVWKTFLFDLLCALGVGAAGLVFPMFVRVLLNKTEAEGIVVSTIIIFVGLMLFVKVVEMFCHYYMTTVGHIMGSKVEAVLRRQLYTKLLSQTNSFYDNHQTGDLMSRVNNDLFEITEFAHHCPEELLLAVFRIVGIFIYLMFIDVYLTLIMFALLPPLIVFAVLSNRRMKSKFSQQRKQISEINSHLEDSLAGISVIKSFGTEEFEYERFEKNNREFLDIKRKTYRVMGFFHSGMLVGAGLMYVVAVIVGMVFIQWGRITTVDLLTYVLYVGTLLSTVQTLTAYFEQFQRGMSGFNRFLEIIDQPIEITSPENAIHPSDFKSEIAFNNVTFSYDEKRNEDILKNISFKINCGETVAIVGPSGAGKTTIANLIPRFYDIISGSITIGGVDIKDMDINVLRQNVGIVQQNVYMFFGTIKENILLGKPSATDAEIIEAAKKAGAHDFIFAFPEGYDTMCGERGVKLSGGQKQRISIARVFLKDPAILILDEATSALDNESERLVQTSLDKLSKDRTSVIIAHRLTTVKNADRILVLTPEGIGEEGTHLQLIEKNGIYANLYKLYAVI